MKTKTLGRLAGSLFLFFLAFSLRLHKIDNPVADWHSWRQADTAAVSRSFYQEEFNLLYPRADNFYPMSEGSLPNPERYFLNEFPFYNSLAAGLYYLNGGVNEVWARLVSVFFSSLGAVLLYLLASQLLAKRTAFLSGLFFAVLPFNIYYGRVIMPDPTFICLSILSLYLAVCWLKKENFLAGLAFSLSLALAILVKPYALFLGLPLAYLILSKWGWKTFQRSEIYLFLIFSLLPFGLWRWHINRFPEGMFGSGWLINQGQIRFSGAFFRWLIFERMNRLIFASGGFVLFWLGLAAPRRKKEGLFFLAWLLGAVGYMTYFARGNVTHDYYQLPLVPVGCCLMAKGVIFLLGIGRDWLSRLINRTLALGLVLLMLAFGWYEVRGFFNINHPEIVEAGRAVDRLTPSKARVIAPYQRDPAFLYQTNRSGWSALDSAEQLREFITDGATHYVSVNFDEITNQLTGQCPVLEKTERYVIVELENCINK